MDFTTQQQAQAFIRRLRRFLRDAERLVAEGKEMRQDIRTALTNAGATTSQLLALRDAVLKIEAGRANILSDETLSDLLYPPEEPEDQV
jgi:uncharacterized protein (UPF0335 family)